MVVPNIEGSMYDLCLVPQRSQIQNHWWVGESLVVYYATRPNLKVLWTICRLCVLSCVPKNNKCCESLFLGLCLGVKTKWNCSELVPWFKKKVVALMN